MIQLRLKNRPRNRRACIVGIRPELVFAVHVALGVFEAAGAAQLVVSSGGDTAHGDLSRHRWGGALDFGLAGVRQDQQEPIRDGLRTNLGDDFNVLLEGVGTTNVHLHVSLRPQCYLVPI